MSAPFPVPGRTPARAWFGDSPDGPAPMVRGIPPDMLRWIRLDPHLRGRVTPTTLAILAAAGLCVHRVGSAAYVHDAERRHRWLLEVSAPGDPVPAHRARREAYHRWLRRRGGEPSPRERARTAAFLEAFAAADDPGLPWWITGARA